MPDTRSVPLDGRLRRGKKNIQIKVLLLVGAVLTWDTRQDGTALAASFKYQIKTPTTSHQSLFDIARGGEERGGRGTSEGKGNDLKEEEVTEDKEHDLRMSMT